MDIIMAKDTNIQDKSNKIGAYVVVSYPGQSREVKADDQDKVKPVVDQVYNYLLGAKVS